MVVVTTVILAVLLCVCCKGGKTTSDSVQSFDETTSDSEFSFESKSSRNDSQQNHAHDFSHWITKTAAACDKNGEKYRYCRICGEKESEIIYAQGYSINNADGRCVVCGKSLQEISCGVEYAYYRYVAIERNDNECCYDIFFIFADSDYIYLVAEGRIEILLLSESNEELYSKTWTIVANDYKVNDIGEDKALSVKIIVYDDEIKESASKKGKFCFQPYSLSNIPVSNGAKLDVDLPEAKVPDRFYDIELLYDNENNGYGLSFCIEDQKGKLFKKDVELELVITNDDQVVYSKSFNCQIVENSDYYEKKYINISDINEGKTSEGTLYIKIKYNEKLCISVTRRLYELPKKQIRITLPSTPKIINYYGYNNKVLGSCKILNLRYSEKQIFIEIEKTYDYEGNEMSSACRIGYKIYDSKGYVVDSGTGYSEAIKVGEKTICSSYVYNLNVDETYRLELLNVS